MATDAQVLALPMPQPNDAGAATVRDYLVKLLVELWHQDEMFSGKRPFGNSGCQYYLYLPLIVAGFVPGVLDEDGYIDNVDDKRADAMIISAIRSLGESA